MYKADKYFYLSLIFVILSIFLSVHNPIVHDLFGSITAIVLFTGLINAILLVLSVLMIDRALKLRDHLSPRLQAIARWWPFVILAVIIYHLVSSIFFFGII